jgi:hypothetical protein
MTCRGRTGSAPNVIFLSMFFLGGWKLDLVRWKYPRRLSLFTHLFPHSRALILAQLPSPPPSPLPSSPRPPLLPLSAASIFVALHVCRLATKKPPEEAQHVDDGRCCGWTTTTKLMEDGGCRPTTRRYELIPTCSSHPRHAPTPACSFPGRRLSSAVEGGVFSPLHLRAALSADLLISTCSRLLSCSPPTCLAQRWGPRLRSPISLLP